MNFSKKNSLIAITLIVIVGFAFNTLFKTDVSDTSIDEQTSYFTNIDSSIEFEADYGMVPIVVMASNEGDRAVYFEVEACALDEQACFRFDEVIGVIDLVTGAKTVLYSTKEGLSALSLFVQPAMAGGCQKSPLPIAWSEHDEQIILMRSNMTTCGSGMYVDYVYQLLNSENGDLQDFAYSGIFTKEYQEIIAEVPDFSAIECVGQGFPLWTKIVSKNVESGEEVILVKGGSVSYRLQSVNEEQKTFSYTSESYEKTDSGCYTFLSDDELVTDSFAK